MNRTPDERAEEAFDAIGEAMAALHYLADKHPSTEVGKEAQQVIFRVSACNDEWQKAHESEKLLEDEATAANKLRLAKNLRKKNGGGAKRWLEEIIRSYPNTKAAAEAKELLKSG